MAFLLSSAAQYFFSRGKYADNDHEADSCHALPIIASPVDPKAYAWLQHKRVNETLVPGSITRSRTVADFEAEHGGESRLAKTIFRKQHEASSLELFFDLFFVANLAVFTDIHAHVNGQSVANYIGFFSIIWTLWFHTSIYDVRFFTDCIFARFCKLFTFGVMASMVGLAPIYDVINDGGMTRAYTGLALVFMAFRFMLALQYAVVLYFVHGFHKTLVPLCLMIAIYIVTGFAFLVTHLVDRNTQLNGMDGPTRVVRWYIIIAGEIVAVLVVSSIWRVLSFKHTHLVERVGLLTLIVMGEGILGMTKSVAYTVLGTNISIGTEIGIVAAAVVLIYLIYVLYFNNIHTDYSEDQFGSIRQQVWALMHYFLHVAILLTVEGQTALIVWEACRDGIDWWNDQLLVVTNARAGYNSSASFVSALNSTLDSTARRFHYYPLSTYYNQTSDLAKLGAINYTYGSPEWNDASRDTIDKMRYYVQYFIFVNFQAEGVSEIEDTSDPKTKVELYNESFQVVFEYFYIGAGGLLLILAAMAWFGRKHKRVDEYISIVIRAGVGLGLPFISLTAFLEKENDTSSFRFWGADWLIPIVTLVFLGVLFADNMSKVGLAVFKRVRGQHRSSRASRASDVETAHAGDAEVHQEKVKHAHFAESQNHGRSGSYDSDTTLKDIPSQSSRGSRGYAHLNQDDAEDEHAPKPLQRH